MKKENIKDKVMLAFYIEVGNISDVDVRAYINKVKNVMNLELYDDMVFLFIPVRGSNTRIERIPTGDVEFEDLETLEEKLKELDIFKQKEEKDCQKKKKRFFGNVKNN